MLKRLPINFCHFSPVPSQTKRYNSRVHGNDANYTFLLNANIQEMPNQYNTTSLYSLLQTCGKYEI